MFVFMMRMNLFRSQDEIAMEAIKHALKSLRKRHLIEEGAHVPAFIALSRPLVLQVLLLCVCLRICILEVLGILLF